MIYKLLLIFSLFFLQLNLAAKCDASIINTKGEVVAKPSNWQEKPVPEWKFRQQNVASNWQVAPTGAEFEFAQRWYVNLSEDRLCVRIKGRLGYVDLQGNLAIPPVYSEAFEFHNGFAIVKQSSQQPFEIIDKNGRVVDTLPAQMQIDFAQEWSQWSGVSGVGLLEVKVAHGKNPVIHGIYSIFKRHLLQMPDNFVVTCFADGMARIEVDGTAGMSKFGFISSTGEIAIRPSFDYADNFCNGLAPVFSQGRWFYIDKSGNEAITLPTNCSQAFIFSEGLAAVALHPDLSTGGFRRKRGDRWGFIDVHGKMVIPANFYTGNGWKPYFSNGLSPIMPADTQLHYYGYIDASGKWAIPPRFSQASVFENGLSLTTVGETKFSKEKWLNAGPFALGTEISQKLYGHRRQLLPLFLNEHPLLKMSRRLVRESLGNPDFSTADQDPGLDCYILDSSGAGYLKLEIDYRLNEVFKYRYSNMSKDQWFDQTHSDLGDWPDFK